MVYNRKGVPIRGNKRPAADKNVMKPYAKRMRSNIRTRVPFQANPRIPRGVTTLQNIPPIQKQRYTSQVSLNPTGGSIEFYHFAANGLYNPDLTGSGHQPSRFDELTGFYDHYAVLNAKITVQTLGNVSTASAEANATPFVWGIYMNDDTTTTNVTTFSKLIEQGKTQWRLSTGTFSTGTQTLSLKYDAAKYFNVTDMNDNTSRLGSTFSANPAESAVFSLWVQAMDSTTDVAAKQFLVNIDYESLWSEPSDVVQS